MKVLVTGANGFLGQHLVKLLLEKGFLVIAIGRGASRLPLKQNDKYNYYAADITEEDSMREVLLKEKPEIIVHAAAMSQVDECEIKKDESFTINVGGTLILLDLSRQYCRHFIYISTDFVFNGQKGNYAENDTMQPLSWYGFTKMEAEQFVTQHAINWSIVRTCLLYGSPPAGGRQNIVTWVKDKLKKIEKIKVVNDQWRTPTYVEDLARGILLVIEKKASGIFHISGKDILTPYQMAVQTADFFSLDKNLIEKVDATTFTQPALRPSKTGFKIDKAREELGYEPLSFAEGLENMVVNDRQL